MIIKITLSMDSLVINTKAVVSTFYAWSVHGNMLYPSSGRYAPLPPPCKSQLYEICTVQSLLSVPTTGFVDGARIGCGAKAAACVYHALLHKDLMICPGNISRLNCITTMNAPFATLHDVASMSCKSSYSLAIIKRLVRGSIVSFTF